MLTGQHLDQVAEPMGYAQVVADRLSLFIQAYTLYSSVRPFGLSCILGAVDNTGPQLYVIEPSGISLVCSDTPLLYFHVLRICPGISWSSGGQRKAASKDRARKAQAL